MTIIDKIKDLRKQYPDNTALFDLKTGNKITFTQIDTKSDEICSYLIQKGFEKELENLSFEEINYLLKGIEKLIYIDIALEKDKDDPQKIFESLNSSDTDFK